jgi:long-chain fatty acid transport protein
LKPFFEQGLQLKTSGERRKEMKKGWLATWFGVLSLVLLPGLALGNGFAINEQGAKAVAMGGAFVAQADDPTAVYYNPAGILQLEGTQVSVGMSPIRPHASFETDGNRANLPPPVASQWGGPAAGETVSIRDTTFWIPNAYMTQKISDTWGFGFGIFSNFGLSTKWDEEWEGRFITGGTQAEITTLSLNPAIAFKPFEKLTLAAGPVLQMVEIELKYKVPNVLGGSGIGPSPLAVPEAGVKLRGDDWDWGWNVGLLYQITDTIKFGASYRSQINHSITKGNVKFTPDGVNGFNDVNGASAPLRLPAIGYLGLSWAPKPFTFEFDMQWTDWSSYNKLKVDFGETIGVGPTATSGLEKEKDWNAVWAYRFGAQYSVTDWLDLRAGYIYDPSPIPSRTLDPLLPAGDRKLYCFGFGVKYEKMAFDFAYNYLDGESRDFNNEVGDSPAGVGLPRMTGRFKDVDAHIFGINLSYKF